MGPGLSDPRLSSNRLPIEKEGIVDFFPTVSYVAGPGLSLLVMYLKSFGSRVNTHFGLIELISGVYVPGSGPQFLPGD